MDLKTMDADAILRQNAKVIAQLQHTKKVNAELTTAVIAGVVAIACLIAGVSAVNSSSTAGGMLIVIAVMIAFVIRYWHRLREEQAKMIGMYAGMVQPAS
jgi:uncharacterized membrane protein YfcA